MYSGVHRRNRGNRSLGRGRKMMDVNLVNEIGLGFMVAILVTYILLMVAIFIWG